MVRVPRRGLGVVLLTVVFFGVAVWVVLTARGRSEPAFEVWAALVVVMAPVNVIVFVSGFRALEELGGRFLSVRSIGVAGGLVGVLAASSVFDLVLDGSGNARGFALVCAALVAAMPSLASFVEIAQAARRAPVGSVGQQIEYIDLLVRVARRLLVGAGSLVALTTVSLGAAIILQHQREAHGASGQDYSSDVVLIFGGIGSALLGCAYLPGAVAIRARAGRLASALFPLPGAGVGGQEILAVLRDRAQLTQLLGIDRTVWNDIQSGSVILAPLLAAGLATFISPT